MFLLKFLFKTFFFLFLVLLFFLVAVVGVGMWVAPHVVPSLADEWLSSKTGFSLTIEELKMKYLDGSVKLSGVAVENPSDYQDNRFIEISNVAVGLDWKSLLKDTIRVRNISVNLDALTVVKNAQGVINVMQFKESFEAKTAARAPSAPRKSAKKSKGYKIDRLKVSIGKLYVVGVPLADSSTKEFDVSYNKEFRDVTDIGTVTKQIAEDMKQYGVSILATAILEEPVKAVQRGVETAVKQTKEKVIDNITDPSKAIDAVKELPKALGDGIKGIFNSL